ncbi:MAG: amino acid deaminase [Candidatus Dormiibacterota bacterium]
MELEGHLHKALPPISAPTALAEVGARGWHALGGDLAFPVFLLKDGALRHNQETMSAFCAAHRVRLAPHGKTTMSAQLIRRQLAAGAWAITAANAVQARAMRAFGAERVIIANQVVDPVGIHWIGEETAAHPNAWIASLVDSIRGVELFDEGLAAVGPPRQAPVLVEVGAMGARTGCRTLEEGLAVADAVARSRHLQLVGVEGYEGALGGGSADDTTLQRIDAFCTSVRQLLEALAARGDFDRLDEILVTAGGSSYFDRVVAVLGEGWDVGRPVALAIRSGCYLTHDHGNYRVTGPLGHRSGGPELQPAMEIWGLVNSRPEPGLALLGFGKRDVSYDAALPNPLRVRSRDGVERPAGGMTVTKLNDQHAYLQVPPDDPLQVGDLVGCGLSHPCTAFDKWRVVPIVDDDYRVLEVAETAF